jgi:hypothetical protein
MSSITTKSNLPHPKHRRDPSQSTFHASLTLLAATAIEITDLRSELAKTNNTLTTTKNALSQTKDELALLKGYAKFGDLAITYLNRFKMDIKHGWGVESNELGCVPGRVE